MDPISKLLERYLKITPPDDAVRASAQKALKEVCGVVVPKEKISYSFGTVLFNVSPSMRSKILTNKEKIVELIESSLGKKIKDIR